jgi:hypothetical protein
LSARIGEPECKLHAYIELNPVRAAMVDDPAHYRWSSYRSNALGKTYTRLTPHALYLALDRNEKDLQAAYRALFRSHLDRAAVDDIRLALKSEPTARQRALLREGREDDRCAPRGQAKRAAEVGH